MEVGPAELAKGCRGGDNECRLVANCRISEVPVHQFEVRLAVR
jgi:hypothetical protein